MYSPNSYKAYNESSEESASSLKEIKRALKDSELASLASVREKKEGLLKRLQPMHQNSFGWALACCEWDQSLAEDVLQEAYLRVVDGRASFAGKSSEKTWFFAVIKRVSQEQRKSIRSWLRLSNKMTAMEPEAANDDFTDQSFESLSQKETNDELITTLKSLSSRQREILHLVFYTEMSIEEAAFTLGISLGSARTHYQRGKENLAKLLQQ